MDGFYTALVSTAPTILWPALSPPCTAGIGLPVRRAITLGGNINNLRLSGGSNFVAVSGNTITLIYDGTRWVENGRGTSASA